MRVRSTRLLGLLLFAALLAPPTAARRDSDRGAAEAILAELGADRRHAKLAAEPIARARDALDRARDARGAADAEHGALLEAVGRQWAEAARDLTRAVAAEQRVHDAEKKTSSAEEQLTRARAVLEDTVLRRARAQAQLDELEPKPAAKPVTGAKP